MMSISHQPAYFITLFWLKALKNDPKLVVLAGAQAQKAVDYITGREFEATLEAKAA